MELTNEINATAWQKSFSWLFWLVQFLKTNPISGQQVPGSCACNFTALTTGPRLWYIKKKKKQVVAGLWIPWSDDPLGYFKSDPTHTKTGCSSCQQNDQTDIMKSDAACFPSEVGHLIHLTRSKFPIDNGKDRLEERHQAVAKQWFLTRSGNARAAGMHFRTFSLFSSSQIQYAIWPSRQFSIWPASITKFFLKQISCFGRNCGASTVGQRHIKIWIYQTSW